MGKLLGALFVMLLLMCFCIYNWWELREKSKRLFADEKKKVNPLNSHIAWGIYAVITLFAILGVVGYQIYKLINLVYAK